MQNLFVASKHSTLPNYIFLFLREFAKNHEFRLVNENQSPVNLLVIDVDTTTPAEAKQMMGDFNTILFTRKVAHHLISYTSILDINGVISLDMEPEEIHKTLEEAVKGEIYYHDEMISLLFSPKTNELAEKVASITSREIDIVRLMLRDMTNEEIASELNLSIRTVNAHKGNIMRKIGAKTTCGMVKIIMDYYPNIY